MKKVILALMCVVMLLCLASCAAQQKADNNAKGNTDFRIYAFCADEAVKTSLKNGVELAKEHINDASFPVTFDAYNGESAIEDYNSCYKNGMQITFGALKAESFEEIAKKAAADNILLISPAVNESEALALKNVFSIYNGTFDASSTDEKTKAFVEAYKAKYNASPDEYAANAYDAIQLIYQCMKSAKVTDSKSTTTVICNAVTGEMTKTDFKFEGVTGTYLLKDNALTLDEGEKAAENVEAPETEELPETEDLTEKVEDESSDTVENADEIMPENDSEKE